MSLDDRSMEELHWLLGIVQHVDVGLVVLDRDYRVMLWNGFMENHSGVRPIAAIGRPLFEVLPDIPEAWLRRKVETVFLLDNRTFSTWQQRRYLTRFDSYHPLTAAAQDMYQNVTLFPLSSVNGRVDHVCLMIYDVTDSALNELSLQAANGELEKKSQLDGLTGLYNRRTWEELLHHEYKRERRSRRMSSLVMVDIDHFKRVNDTWGHPAGDEVIRTLAAVIEATKRDTDIAGRYGGEEFCVLLADSPEPGGAVFAERLRAAVEARPALFGDQIIPFTISVGVAENDPAFVLPTQWIAAADQALYCSKQQGRNRVTIHGA